MLMLPPGVVGYADVQVELTGEVKSRDVRTEAQEQLITVLDAKGQLRGRQLDRLLPRQQWRRAASQLARRGVIAKSPFLAPPRARPKQVRTIEWTAHDVDPDTAMAGLKSECYPSIVEFLRTEDDPVDVSWVYAETGCTRYHLNKLAERGLVTFDIEEVWRDPLADATFVPDTPPHLTSDQQAVWEEIREGISRVSRRVNEGRANGEGGSSSTHSASTYLLHGVTGSGKTEIYLRAVEEVLERGRQAIVLVPEISLTPQTAHRFGARFGRRIAILHSALTDGERYDTWRRARAGLVGVVIGPRSALFVPLPNIGLIVLDEEHDDSYKQEEIEFEEGTKQHDRLPLGPLAPFYHARDAALELARMTGASVILGSATPSLESYHRAQRGKFKLLEMPRRIMGHTRRLRDLQARHHIPRIRDHALRDGPAEARYMPLPPVQIVDLIFSRALQRAMDEALGRGEQVILFLNRRGTATFVLCRDCGYVVKCPRCDTPLTYHSPHAHLVCHHCNYHKPRPKRCPQCGGKRIRYFGLGTERVEQEVHQRWLDVRTLRWDRDTARNHAAHAAILHLFSTGLAHVLVGTQMIAKGLDLPLVTVVGIISADTALNLPDFRSGDDYAGFAARELAFRREQGYPPYRRLAKLVYEETSPSRARAEAQALVETLRDALARRGLPATDLIGPVPPFFARLRGRYRWQILLRHSDPAEFLRAVQIPPGWRVDVDPVSVL
jgi:primosomal protein N' (replication factor Y)